MTWLIIVLVVAVSAAGILIADHVRLRRYWERTCTGASWRSVFPDATKGEIREFLGMFVSAFGFGASRRLAFEPADRVMDIYRARYPSRGWPVDSLELETLAALARKRYALDLLSFWRDDVTLGELFERPRRRGASHGVAADSPPSPSLGPLASLARLAAERSLVGRHAI
jgi:hypothetical protein